MRYLKYMAVILAIIVSLFTAFNISSFKNIENISDLTIVDIHPAQSSNAYLLPENKIVENGVFGYFGQPVYIEMYEIDEIVEENLEYIVAELELDGLGEKLIICLPDGMYVVSDVPLEGCNQLIRDDSKLIISDGRYNFRNDASGLWGDWNIMLSNSTNQVQHVLEEIGTSDIEDDLMYIKSAYGWVQKNLLFSYDLQHHSPTPDVEQVLENRSTDCKGFSAVLATLLKARGIESRLMLVKTQSENSAINDYLLNGYDHTILYLPDFDIYLDPTIPDSLPGEFYVNERRFEAYDVLEGFSVNLLDHMRNEFFLSQKANVEEVNGNLIFEISAESFGSPISDLDLFDLEAKLDRYLEIYTNIPRDYIILEDYEYVEESTRRLSIKYSVATDEFIRNHESDSILPVFHGYKYPEDVADCIGHRRVSVSLVNNADSIYFTTHDAPFREVFIVRNVANGIELISPTDPNTFECEPGRLYGPERDDLIFHLYSPRLG